MATKGKGSAGVDKGRMFEKTVAASILTQKSASGAGRTLSQKDRSGVVARAFATASARTGAFESRNAKK